MQIRYISLKALLVSLIILPSSEVAHALAVTDVLRQAVRHYFPKLVIEGRPRFPAPSVEDARYYLHPVADRRMNDRIELSEEMIIEFFAPANSMINRLNGATIESSIDQREIAKGWRRLVGYLADVSKGTSAEHRPLILELAGMIGEGLNRARLDHRIGYDDIESLALYIQDRFHSFRDPDLVTDVYHAIEARIGRNAYEELELNRPPSVGMVIELQTWTAQELRRRIPPVMASGGDFRRLTKDLGVSGLGEREALLKMHEDFASRLIQRVAQGRISLEAANRYLTDAMNPLFGEDSLRKIRIGNQKLRFDDPVVLDLKDDIRRVWTERLSQTVDPEVPHPFGFGPPKGRTGFDMGIEIPQRYFER